ncbi:MAG: ABC transporter substrate-binding protein [Bacteroidetes bacterium]|nr:ABC transporter substrate-binding protein [Bacteroidota bacterium]
MSRLIHDMMNREVWVSESPQKIISLVPSQTELLYDLGLEEEVVGITKFCVHPYNWWRHKVRVGGTKQLNLLQIDKLQPDLIIANKEENTQEQIEALATRYPVWLSDINSFEDALRMIQSIGTLVNHSEEANGIIKLIVNGFSNLIKQFPNKRVAYFIWYQPWMCAGENTFIHQMLAKMGWDNVMPYPSRYPEVSLEYIKSLNPDLCLLSSEPFPFKEKQAEELRAALPESKILFVDGEMFSWYGSRMIKAAHYLESLLLDV